MLKYHWAVRPRGKPGPIRIKRTYTGAAAVDQAFGRTSKPEEEVGKWEAKNLGTVADAFRTEKKRVALLDDPAGWIDPFVNWGQV